MLAHLPRRFFWGVENYDPPRYASVLEQYQAQLAEWEANAINMSVWCYWFNESGDRIPDIPDDIRALMESMEGTIEIDEYR